MSVTFYPCHVLAETPDGCPVRRSDKVLASSNLNDTYVGTFSNVCARAYDNHYHLVLTPDAIWNMIMTQFAIYVENHAEHLREKFVAHEGKKNLTVYTDGTLLTTDYPSIVKHFIIQMKKYLKDPSIAEWAVPEFSTTTDDDRIVGAICLMAGTQNYFSYSYFMRCGLPQVTLLGTPEDWQQLRERTSRLLEFDCDQRFMKKWHQMLDPIMEQFIKSSQGQPNLKWWNQITNHVSKGSGVSYYSGWLTVFNVFDEHGSWRGQRTLGAKWPKRESGKMAPCLVEVPMTVDDRGTVYETMFSAGLSSFRIINRAIQPISSWRLDLLKSSVPN
jgi:hypothetical protein